MKFAGSKCDRVNNKKISKKFINVKMPYVFRKNPDCGILGSMELWFQLFCLCRDSRVVIGQALSGCRVDIC